MTVTVEHVTTAHSGLGTTPRYRCHCGATFRDAGAAHGCRHRARPVMPDRHEPSSQLTLLEDR